jgi:hypothetical protein
VTRGAALAPLFVEVKLGAEMARAEIAAPPIVTHHGMVTTYRSQDQMMAAFAADMATGKWECDDEDRRKLAEWQAARQRKPPQLCRVRRPRSRTSHRRVARVGSARPSTKAGASDPDDSSSEPLRSRQLAIRGALDVGDIPPRYRPPPTVGGESSPANGEPPRRYASSGREVTALALEVCR